MDDQAKSPSTSLADVENWLALGAGSFLLVAGASRRSMAGMCVALSSVPLLYRGVTGYWPAGLGRRLQPDDTRSTLSGTRGIHVRASVRVKRPVSEVYRFWRRLENLPRFMAHLKQVSEKADGISHWVTLGPAGLAVEWDAEIINEVENSLIAWRSLPGSDVHTAGSVTFESERGGRATTIRVHLQYAPPAGKTGALVASMFRREPSQTIREDLGHLKHLLEAGGVPRETPA